MFDLSFLFNVDEEEEKTEVERLLDWYSYDNFDYSVWKTKDGDLLSLDEMQDDHIDNCITMLNRQIDKVIEIVKTKIAQLDIDVNEEIKFIGVASLWIDSFKKQKDKREKASKMCGSPETVNAMLEKKVAELIKENCELREAVKTLISQKEDLTTTINNIYYELEEVRERY